MTRLKEPHPHPGLLIVVEGIDGSGKTTQAHLLKSWLESRGEAVFFTEWNSSELVKKATRAGKKSATLTPLTFSLMHATDFADRHLYQIVPPLKAGMIVIADRYAYTAFARDEARGVHPEWLRNTYSFATRPDVALYFRVSTDVALERLSSARAKIKYYEAGMDMRLSADIAESFGIFQSRVVSHYDRLCDEYGLTTIDATRTIPDQQAIVRDVVLARLRERRRGGAA
ncbi:MAG: dTMP kinase [Phycisphaerales bacterium]|nr:dTMP kinase [Phycisphaerales bacterium]